MVRIRLRRMGKKKQPFYRIVAVDSRGRRDGKYIEKIGHYDPISTPTVVLIDEEKAIKWLKAGAVPSDTVNSFFKQKGILLRFDLMKKGYEEAAIAEELTKWQVLQLERQRRLEAKSAQEERAKEKPAAKEPASAEAEPAAKAEEVSAPAEAAVPDASAGAVE